MKFIDELREKVKSLPTKKIVFPEGEEARIIAAAAYLSKNKLVQPVLLGRVDQIAQLASKTNNNIDSIEIINPLKEVSNGLITDLYNLRKHKGVDKDKAAELLKNPLYYAALIVRNDYAHGAVAGSVNTTGDVLRAAIQVIGLKKGINTVSSSFLMVMPDGRLLTFADCAVIPDPDIEELASIAISSAQTHTKITGEKTKIAMLSFSTKGSAEHEKVSKIIEVTDLVRTLDPSLNVDGELQFDAAFDPTIGKSKTAGSPVAGEANVFIFPDLNAGNIGYKIAQRMGNAQAIGPIIQGLAKPYNDLSRGCSVDDVINTACICSLLSN